MHVTRLPHWPSDVQKTMKTKKSSKQEMKHESPTRGRMEMDEIWLWVKKEIKEELEKDMMSENFESDILMQGVMMKEEIEVDAKRTQTCSNLQVAKRRRLTGGDMQKIMRAEAAEDPRCPSSVKKELADGVNVKKEPFACDMQIMQEAVNHKDRSSRILSGLPRCNNSAEEWNKKAWTNSDQSRIWCTNACLQDCSYKPLTTRPFFCRHTVWRMPKVFRSFHLLMCVR